MDNRNETFAIGESESVHVFKVTEQTNITRNEAPATFRELQIGDEVRGSYWKRSDNTVEAKTIKATSLGHESRAAAVETPDIRTFDLQKLAYAEAVAIMRKNWPQETPTNFTAEPSFEDFTGDGLDEAVMVIRYRSSGEASTSSFSQVLVYGMRDSTPALLATLEGGDRAYGGVERVKLENHRLVLSRYRPKTETACMACYGFIETTVYRWDRDKFVPENSSVRKYERAEPGASPQPNVRNEAFSPNQQYPYATWSGTAGFVVSPYPPHSLIDIRGFSSGQYVRDPSTGKIFCVPP